MNQERFTLRKGAQLTRLVAYVSALLRDKDVEIIVKEHKPKRSDCQNRLLWSIYAEILQRGAEAMAGWTKDDLHELFLGMHFGWEIIEGFGQKRKKPIRRSSRLNTVEFTEFVDFILRYMAEQGVYIAMPGELAA
jgi:hypothetical protein